MGLHVANGGPLRQRGYAHDAPDSARARVRRGIKWLNTFVAKGWRKNIDIATLDMTSGDNCVLGQATKRRYTEAVFQVTRTGYKPSDLGFMLTPEQLNTPNLTAKLPELYAPLTAAWKSELRSR